MTHKIRMIRIRISFPSIHPSIIPVIHFQKNKKIKLNWIEFQSDFNNFSENFYYKFNKPTSQTTTKRIKSKTKERTKKKVITKYRWPLFAKRRKKKYCCSIQSINFFSIHHSFMTYLSSLYSTTSKKLLDESIIAHYHYHHYHWQSTNHRYKWINNKCIEKNDW